MALGQKRSPHVTQPLIVDIEGHTSNETINNCKTLLHMTIIVKPRKNGKNSKIA